MGERRPPGHDHAAFVALDVLLEQAALGQQDVTWRQLDGGREDARAGVDLHHRRIEECVVDLTGPRTTQQSPAGPQCRDFVEVVDLGRRNLDTAASALQQERPGRPCRQQVGEHDDVGHGLERRQLVRGRKHALDLVHQLGRPGRGDVEYVHPTQFGVEHEAYVAVPTLDHDAAGARNVLQRRAGYGGGHRRVDVGARDVGGVVRPGEQLDRADVAEQG